MTTPDIILTGGGTIYTLLGTTPEGTAWLDDNLDPEAMRCGEAYVVEHRYVDDIVEGAMNDGLLIQ